MKLNEAFPSNFITSADLNGKDVVVVIEEVKMERIGQGRDAEDKLLLTFRGKKKGLITNKTNAKTIGKLYGDDTDDWIGKAITIGPREVEFQGDMVWAIRVSLRAPASAAPAAQPAATPPPSTPCDETGAPVPEEDSTPF